MIISFFAMMAIMEETKAQELSEGLYVPAPSGYVLGDTTRMVKVFGPFNGTSETARVGVYYTKGASEDSLSKVRVFHALDPDILTAGYGEQVSTDTDLRFGNTAATEYKEQVISFTGGIRYLGIQIVPVGTATDTTNIKPYIFID